MKILNETFKSINEALLLFFLSIILYDKEKKTFFRNQHILKNEY